MVVAKPDSSPGKLGTASHNIAEDSVIKRKLESSDSSDSITMKKPKIDAVNNTEEEPQQKSSCANDIDGNWNSAGSLFIIDAAAAEDKGSRHNMEDASVVLLPHPTSEDSSNSSFGRCAHFAVYDGHGGRLAAEYAQNHLHFNVLSAGLPRESLDVKAAKKAILDGFRTTDEALLLESAAGGWQDGATAVCAWILGQTVFVANIGDAKAVVARSASMIDQKNANGLSPLRAIVLTREHKAIYPQERARIQKAGGSVSTTGRLQGRLEVSRAFGDRQFKKVGVIAIPHIQSFDLTEKDNFIILGCDGLWGVLGPSDAVDFVHKLLKDGVPVASVCRRLVREAVLERGCTDNCTAVVVVFRRN